MLYRPNAEPASNKLRTARRVWIALYEIRDFIFDLYAIKMCRCGGAQRSVPSSKVGHNENNGTRGKLARAATPWAPPTGVASGRTLPGDGVTDAGWRVNREDCRLLVHPRAMPRVMGLPLALTGVPFPKPNLVQYVVDRM